MMKIESGMLATVCPPTITTKTESINNNNNNFQMINDNESSNSNLLLCRPIIIIGIGGCSCSGKSTFIKSLVTFLESIIPVFVLRQDRFFRGRSEVPIDSLTGYINWESPKAIDMPSFLKTLKSIKEITSLDILEKFWSESHLNIDRQINKNDEEKNKDIASLNEETIKKLVYSLSEIIIPNDKQLLKKSAIVLVDGYLMFESPDISKYLDKAFFLETKYETCSRRRKDRSAKYVCAEGTIWEDPEYFFKDLTWPSYLKNNKVILEAEIIKDISTITTNNDNNNNNNSLVKLIKAYQCNVLVFNSDNGTMEKYAKNVSLALINIIKDLY